jgi:2-hydroxy-3-oxopropionate reductase
MGVATNLVRAGFDVMVYDVRSEPIRELAAAGAKVARSLGELGAHNEIILLAVVDDTQVEEVVLGVGGVLESSVSGRIIVCHSTIRPRTIKKIAERAARKGVGVVDAPVSGGARGARERTLCIMVGGDSELVERCRPLFEAYGGNIFHLGELGAGLTAKLAHQTILALNIAGAAEGMALAEAAGVAPKMIQPVVHVAGAQSMVADNWTDFRPGSHGTRLFHKDLTIALEVSHELGLSMPAAALVRELLPKLLHD